MSSLDSSLTLAPIIIISNSSPTDAANVFMKQGQSPPILPDMYTRSSPYRGPRGSDRSGITAGARRVHSATLAYSTP